MPSIFVIQAKPELLQSDHIPKEFRRFFGELISYSFPSGVNILGLADVAKQMFLANMRAELGDRFFDGDAELTPEFFDRWWTLSLSHDEPAEMLLNRLEPSEFEEIISAHSDAVRKDVERIVKPMLNADDESPIDEMRYYVGREVAGGYYSREEIVESLAELFAKDHNEHLVSYALESITDDELQKHLQEQRTWPDQTDCETLDQAFDELNMQGILARQNVKCCGTCAGGEVADEMERLIKAGKNIRGYTFFDEQDTESAISRGRLYLSYGSATSDENSSLAVAKEICATLKRHGLTVKWNGSYSRRIGLRLKWQKRRDNT